MLTDEKRQRGEALNSLCVFPSQMSQRFCRCGGKLGLFVAWRCAFGLLSEGKAVITERDICL